MKTVKEVIEMLKDFDPDEPLVVTVEGSHPDYAWEVESIGIDEDDEVNMYCTLM